MGTYLRYIHKVDIYQKITTEQPSGQRTSIFTPLSVATKCIYFPVFSGTRMSPSIEQYDTFKLTLPAEAEVDYGSRFYNITDRVGNPVDAGPFEVDSLLRQEGFSGKIHHLSLIIKRVIE